MKKAAAILGLICAAAVFSGSRLSAQAIGRTELHNSGVFLDIPENFSVSIYGQGNAAEGVSPADLRISNEGLIDNKGEILLTGDFVNENVTDNPFVLPRGNGLFENGYLKMWGDTIQYFRGTPAVFNDLWLVNNGGQHINPKVHRADEFVHTGNRLRIDGCELSTCDGTQPTGFKMTVMNIDPASLEYPLNGYVSAEDDIGGSRGSSSDAFSGPTTPYNGGRLVRYMQDNPTAEYFFPVGNKNLPEFRRMVTLKTQTTEIRKFMVRCVAKNAVDDLYTFVQEGPDSMICQLNEKFYHIIEDSIARAERIDTNRTRAYLKIDYMEGGDGVFDDVGMYDENPANTASPQWKPLMSAKTTGNGMEAFEKDVWGDYWYPVFALFPFHPFRGMTLTKDPNTPPENVFRNRDTINLADNPANRDGLEYLWELFYVPDQSGSAIEELVGTSSLRRPRFPFDFGIDVSPMAPSLKPGTYCFKMTVSNPAIPDCNEPHKMCIDLLPTRAAYIPTGFSPNNDAENQFMTSWFYGFLDVNVEIYNRWGNKIYSRYFDRNTEPGNVGIDTKVGIPLWNGKTDAGDPVPEGAYVYRVRMTIDPTSEGYEIDKIWEQTGTVTVIY